MRTLIVYGDWLVKRQHFKYLTYENKQQRLKCGGIVGFFQALHYLINKLRPKRVVIGWDGMRAGELKYKDYQPWYLEREKDWKNREKLLVEQDLGPETEKEEHELEIIRQIIKTQRLMENCYVRQLYSEKAEAVDLISGYVNQAKKEADEIIIFSREHEFYQLIGGTISVMTPEMNHITEDNFTQKVGYHKDNELLLNCFLGFGMIEGIKGARREKFIKFFPQLVDEKISYQELCKMAEQKQTESKRIFYEKVLGSIDILMRNAQVLNRLVPIISEADSIMLNQMNHLPLSGDRDINDTIRYFKTDGYEDYISGSLDNFFSIFYSLKVNEMEYRKMYDKIQL